jgi:hypothetical protein
MDVTCTEPYLKVQINLRDEFYDCYFFISMTRQTSVAYNVLIMYFRAYSMLYHVMKTEFNVKLFVFKVTKCKRKLYLS